MIPGFTSTGSKNPAALFGAADGMPRRMTRASGCFVWDDEGRRYTDTMMALGAVALGYAHPGVTAAVEQAARHGAVGSLAPVLEDRVASRLVDLLPQVECVRFFKTGAEAVAAAVRIARVYTGRERIVTCGYHGWLDGLAAANGVPAAIQRLRTEVPFNDVTALTAAVHGDADVAAVVIEPVVEEAPSAEWIAALHNAVRRTGAVFIADEIKTGLRLGLGGASERFGLESEVVVLGKALGNGFPLAAVCGRKDVMNAFTRTWVSSTLATEFVSLAAANAVLDVFEDGASARLGERGKVLYDALASVVAAAPRVAGAVRGLPEMCYIRWVDDEVGGRVSANCAREGVLFKRDAYNFVSLAHDDDALNHACTTLDAVVAAL